MHLLHTDLLILLVAAFCLAQLVARFPMPAWRRRPASTEDYLFKVARVTGKSEYDVFCKSAESWPVSQAMVNEDFKEYLQNNTVPYYVNDFIRKNKVHIDSLQIPPF
jgi:hypothetical protein